MGRSTSRSLALTVALLALVLTVTSAPAVAKVTYTSKTVVVDKATVKQNLIGLSKDGKTFQFKRAAGALAKLKAGKVMLLQGTDAVLVSKVSRSKGKLLVSSRAATLPDLVKSADINFTGPVNFEKAFLVRTDAQASKGRAAERFVAPGYPYVGPPPAKTAAGPTLSIQGSRGPLGYSLGFTPSSPKKIDIAGTICFQRGAVCSAGPSNGLSAEINLEGFIQAGDTNVGMKIDGGSVTNSNISIKNLDASLKMTYTLSRGQGDPGQSPPVFRVPVAVDYTIPVSGIPLYFKLQTALLLKLGVSSKNAVIRGGAQVSTAGAGQITQSGEKVDAGGSGNQVDATILGNDNGGGSSISLAPSGTVVAVQFPRLGAGLGVTSANGIGYIDMVTSVGQTTGAALAGMFCSNYDLFITLGAGVEAQLGPIVVGSPKKTIFEKSFQRTEPGCPRS